ncbi:MULTISPECIES: tetratricopeptide repeat protein [Cupriavidus]|uniref:tetratricopeptide repeat protein n=1 Tax=Cupriavidus sp. DF5525 TaxID=3160989 RepID=UPI0032DE570E
MRSYTMRDVMEIVGIPRPAVMSLVAAGVVAPSRGERGEYRFSFRDLVVLRTANALRLSNISSGRIRRSMLRTKSLSRDRHPSATSLRAEGNDVIASANGDEWNADSGQMRFDLTRYADNTVVVPHVGAVSDDARRSYELGNEYERQRLDDEAEAAYRQAVEWDPCLYEAWVNLSALLCDRGSCTKALKVLAEARRRFPTSTELLFNQALAFEDTGDFRDALRAYQQCLDLEPDNADAHFNIGRLYDSAGRIKDALRHYNQYRMLTR